MVDSMVRLAVFGRPQPNLKIPQSGGARRRLPMTTVAVVEDEQALRAAVRDALERYGFDVVEGTSIDDARKLAQLAGLLLLDLGLPDGDGLTLCAELSGVVPIIVISARGDEADRVAALEMGADDYLPKPFSTRELVARCRSVLRRGKRALGAAVQIDELVVDVESGQATLRGDELALTTKERELLACLAAQLGRPVRRQVMAEQVWGSSLGYVNRSLDVHMSSLRHKIGPRADGSSYVETVHGVGYRLRP